MPINDVMLRIPMADSEASDMDFWKTDPAKVEVKRAAKKRSAAKSKAAVPVSGAQPSHAAVAIDLPSGNEDEAAPAAGPGLPAGPRLVEDDDVPMSLPSPAESIHDEDPGHGRGRGRGLKRPAAATSKSVPKMKKPAAAELRLAAPAASDAAPPAAAGADEPQEGGRVLKIRGALQVVLEEGMTLGCPKCRDSKVGCRTCRMAQGLRLIGSILARFDLFFWRSLPLFLIHSG